MPMDVSFTFGSFDYFCNQVVMPFCALVGEKIEPKCYARNIDIGGNLLFQPATLAILFIALIMTSIMIYHIKSKYTAVGRKEIVLFFYSYMIVIIIELMLDSGAIPASLSIYPYVVALYNGMIIATYIILLLNGFVGFQWAEDGTATSLWIIRGSAIVGFVASFFISIATFKSIAGFSSESPIMLYLIYFIFCPATILIYVVLQIILVIKTLDDRWPLGDILFSIAFFVIGVVGQYFLSELICNMGDHYLDGLFWGDVFTLLSVMMIYKYWDSITKEDLEFSVGGKTNVWEIKDPMINDEEMMVLAEEHYKLKQQIMGGN
jgi:hypothetical protein